MTDERVALEQAASLIEQMLTGGQHEGPCTGGGWDSCDLHVATAEKRKDRARAWLVELRARGILDK